VSRLGLYTATTDEGFVVPVEELLTGGSEAMWHDLRRALKPLGWKAMAVWVDQDLTMCWVPPYAEHNRVAGSLTPYVEAWATGDNDTGISYRPPIPLDGDVEDDETWNAHYGAREHKSAVALLAWLGAP
jgi:hypothetical protein